MASLQNPLESVTPLQSDPWGVTLTDPKREGGFMSKSVTYLISCDHLKSRVRRRIKDFEFLQAKIAERYQGGLFVPPLNTKALGSDNNVEAVNQQRRFLGFFLQALCRHEVLRDDEGVRLFFTAELTEVGHVPVVS